jgi:hypothetical protein
MKGYDKYCARYAASRWSTRALLLFQRGNGSIFTIICETVYHQFLEAYLGIPVTVVPQWVEHSPFR